MIGRRRRIWQTQGSEDVAEFIPQPVVAAQVTEGARMLTAFGFVAVSVMFASYWLEDRSRWLVLAFAGGSAATALYSGLAHVYPIMIVEAVW